MASIKQSVNENCKQCIYDPAESGNWREQVEACEMTRCPLFEHRPLTGASSKRLASEKWDSLYESKDQKGKDKMLQVRKEKSERMKALKK